MSLKLLHIDFFETLQQSICRNVAQTIKTKINYEK